MAKKRNTLKDGIVDNVYMLYKTHWVQRLTI